MRNPACARSCAPAHASPHTQYHSRRRGELVRMFNVNYGFKLLHKHLWRTDSSPMRIFFALERANSTVQCSLSFDGENWPTIPAPVHPVRAAVRNVMRIAPNTPTHPAWVDVLGGAYAETRLRLESTSAIPPLTAFRSRIMCDLIEIHFLMAKNTT